MSTPRDEGTQAALDKVLTQFSLGHDTRLYREAPRDALQPTAMPGVYRLTANPQPSESVVDVYGNGYVMQAEEAGPGLAFAESPSPNWQETVEMRAVRSGHHPAAGDLVEVEVRLGDVLRQGGLIYPVESVSVERAWYITLPADSVDVREALPSEPPPPPARHMTEGASDTFTAEFRSLEWDLVLEYEGGALPASSWNESTLDIVARWYAKNLPREQATARYEQHFHKNRHRLTHRRDDSLVDTHAIEAVDAVWQSVLARALDGAR
jgi:hypothetical protein